MILFACEPIVVRSFINKQLKLLPRLIVICRINCIACADNGIKSRLYTHKKIIADWLIRGSKNHYKRTIIGTPEKRYLNI